MMIYIRTFFNRLLLDAFDNITPFLSWCVFFPGDLSWRPCDIFDDELLFSTIVELLLLFAVPLEMQYKIIRTITTMYLPYAITVCLYVKTSMIIIMHMIYHVSVRLTSLQNYNLFSVRKVNRLTPSAFFTGEVIFLCSPLLYRARYSTSFRSKASLIVTYPWNPFFLAASNALTGSLHTQLHVVDDWIPHAKLRWKGK